MRCYRVRVVYDRWETRKGGDGVSESSYCECIRALDRQDAIRKTIVLEREENPGGHVKRIVATPRGEHRCTAE
jgi:hypothetical protein